MKLFPLTAVALSVTVALSACNNAPAPITEPTPVQSLSGTAKAAAGSNLSLMVSDGQPLGSAVTVAADGSFTVPLVTPDTARLQTITKALAGLPCDVKTTVVSSDPNAVGLGVSGARAGGTEYLPVTVNRTLLSRHVELHAWVYSDRATTLTGELDCARATDGVMSSLPVTINASLAQGWTPVVAKIDASIGLSGLTGSGNIATGLNYQGTWLTLTEFKKQLMP